MRPEGGIVIVGVVVGLGRSSLNLNILSQATSTISVQTVLLPYTQQSHRLYPLTNHNEVTSTDTTLHHRNDTHQRPK